MEVSVSGRAGVSAGAVLSCFTGLASFALLAWLTMPQVGVMIGFSPSLGAAPLALAQALVMTFFGTQLAHALIFWARAKRTG